MPNTRSQSEPLHLQINDIEHYLRVRRRVQEYRDLNNLPPTKLPDISIPELIEESKMADVPNPPRALKEYAVPSQAEPHNSIAAPAIARNDFELKPSLLSAVQQNQFSGSPTDDLNLHLSVFVQYTDTIKANGVNPEADTIAPISFFFKRQSSSMAPISSYKLNHHMGWV